MASANNAGQGGNTAGKYLTPDEYEEAARREFGGKSSGEIDTAKGPTEIDSVTGEYATQVKRITSAQGGAKFSGGNAAQFERTVAYAQEQGLKVRYVITEQVQETWIEGLLAKAKEIGELPARIPSPRSSSP